MDRSAAQGSYSENDSVNRVDEQPVGGVSRNVLLIAYHYPPCQESSGHLRTLAFSRYLPEFGWNPVVLSASARAYSKTDDALCDRIPESVPVVRAFARNAAKQFSIRGKYPALFAVPDRRSSWWFGAVPAGLAAIRRYHPQVLWATQPSPTAFWIAHTLHRFTGIPWVADFRDPIAEGQSRIATRMCRWIERKTMQHCSRAVFTTDGAAELYSRRYPDRSNQQCTVIPNGYDEDDFEGLDVAVPPQTGRPLQLVHSGLLYPEGRDPRALFSALGQLKKNGQLSSRDVKIVLRAAGDEAYYKGLIDFENIADMVQLKSTIPYRQALGELCASDGLLVLQGSQFNGQVPAKIYEYMRTQRPVLALTDPAGNTARALVDAGINTIVPIDQADRIAAALLKFVNNVRNGTADIASQEAVKRYVRKTGARQLATLFDDITNTEKVNG